jgi:tRNA (uracil-5-)-methyltransferase TRM9
MQGKEASLENEHVHSVYAAIAPHFSDTRHKPWPVVDSYLASLSPYSLGADIGCGNGKYIGVNKSLAMLGSDRCENLIKIVVDRGHEGLVCDGLALAYRTSVFDFCISIAVIHHFSTPERRRAAVAEITRVLKPGGTALIFVWALEQTVWLVNSGTKEVYGAGCDGAVETAETEIYYRQCPGSQD